MLCGDGNIGGTEKFGRAVSSGPMLMFRLGRRPDIAAMRVALAGSNRIHISYDPGRAGATSNSSDADDSPELLIDGITFDLFGFAPHAPVRQPQFRHRFDVAEDIPWHTLEAVELRVGAHLSGGERMLPVIRAQTALAAALAERLDHIVAVGWPPASSLCGAEYFCRIVTAWHQGGPFPVPGLVAFKEDVDGGLQSEGMACLTGQELRLEPPLPGGLTAATQLAIRLVSQFVAYGRLEEVQAIVAPDGRSLRLEPSRNLRFIRVWGA